MDRQFEEPGIGLQSTEFFEMSEVPSVDLPIVEPTDDTTFEDLFPEISNDILFTPFSQQLDQIRVELDFLKETVQGKC